MGTTAFQSRRARTTMGWNRISGLWSDYQAKAKVLETVGVTSLGKRTSARRQSGTATRVAAGIEDPLVRQMDYRQRMALLKREIDEVEREVVRMRVICEETRETLRRLDKTADEAK